MLYGRLGACFNLAGVHDARGCAGQLHCGRIQFMKKVGDMVVIRCAKIEAETEDTWLRGRITQTVGTGFLGLHNGRGVCARHVVETTQFKWRERDPWRE